MRHLVLFFILILVGGKIHAQNYPDYEMRGAWITTVVNLDWPSSPDLSPEEQREELIHILDQLKAAGKNAVFFQVRSEADAMFPSPYEPWSYWLTGEQGRPPEPFYDPLRFAITEAHKRGMELHAWLNPYRAHRNLDLYPHHESHIARTRPEWTLSFNGASGTYLMLNPALNEVNQFIVDIVSDLVRRYDLDGIHFDDYFYPYSPKITDEDLPQFQADPRGIESIEDWRRDNINRMVVAVNEAIKSIDPQVKFGVSPFGIRKNSDAGTTGGEGYHLIYADPLQWLTDQSIDYIAPQLYWQRDHEAAPYEPLLNWWAEVSEQHQRHVYIGLAPYRLGEPFNWSVEELLAQLQINRKAPSPVHGSIYFRAQHVIANDQGLRDSLVTNWHSRPVLVPPMPWLPVKEMAPVEQLDVYRNEEGIRLLWSGHDETTRFAIFRYPEYTDMESVVNGYRQDALIGITGEKEFTDEQAGASAWLYAVRPLGRNSELGQARVIHVH